MIQQKVDNLFLFVIAAVLHTAVVLLTSMRRSETDSTMPTETEVQASFPA